MKLVIVESPTKAKTISKFLSDEYRVESSLGHVRDLPKSKLGIDIEKNFEPTYIVPVKSKKHVSALKKEARGATGVVLATDEDREGEAIAWHLVQVLGLHETKVQNPEAKSIERIVFHEITKEAIEEALKNPRSINMNRVDAQQARRILDRLVGYGLSPFLWKKLFRGLSAGRVQSVALRLVVEREREIQNFKPEEFWTIEAKFVKDGKEFSAELKRIENQKLEKFDIRTAEDAQKIARAVDERKFTVTTLEHKIMSRKGPAPLTTSTLQQEGSKRLGFSAKQTMRIAQMLYEQGHITYMRTDSLNLSEQSLAAAQEFLNSAYGHQYAADAPKRYKATSKGAQEAHEAVRPSNPSRIPENMTSELEPQLLKLYRLIWQRFMASQMPDAKFNTTSAEFSVQGNDGREYVFGANGITLQFDGFSKVWKMKTQEVELPEFKEQETLTPEKIEPLQHFTQPPPRYSEASLVKTLEEYGIGRPSTYAPTISLLQGRNYIEKNEQRRFVPTETGYLVNDLLVEHFPQVVDVGFTAKMEEDLDKIAEGAMEWQPVVKEFYTPFKKNLEEKYESVEKKEVEDETTDEICEKCGKPMVIKRGRFGKFMACSGFPECKSTKTIKVEPTKIGMKCPECKEGDIVERWTRKKRKFYGCSRWPECKYASWKNPAEQVAENTQNNTAED